MSGFAVGMELCEPCCVAVTPEQTAKTLHERSLAARQERRARAQRIRGKVLAIVREHLPPNARAWLIGSLAWGDFGERSDVDLVLYGVSSARATELELALVRSLELAVDLLQFDNLEDDFRQRILIEGMSIHDG